MTRCARFMGSLALAFLLFVAVHAEAGQPSNWTVKVANGVALSTFPTSYALDFGVAESGAFRLSYTYGGTGTVTVTYEGSVDGTNWSTIQTIVNASSSNASEHRIAITADTAGTTTPHVVFPHYRLRFTAAGGSPSLTGVSIWLYRKGGTVE